MPVRYDRTHVVAVLHSHGITGQRQLAREIQVAPMTARRILRGEGEASGRVVAELHQRFGITPASLLIPAPLTSPGKARI
ncbi:helix-turn-helix domain-containing protein [Streptomyces sp. NPDC057540]|uniref:helix-turn-helix domain-containing protein n=1 Tax=Streptomyces sp. NPDC057540 TaxID=3346160 RepID=UPI00368977F6